MKGNRDLYQLHVHLIVNVNMDTSVVMEIVLLLIHVHKTHNVDKENFVVTVIAIGDLIN